MPVSRARLLEIRQEIRWDLETNILPFWIDRSIDRVHGGYHTHIDREGRVNPEGAKLLVMQTRMAWSFAAAARHGYRPKECVELSTHGVRFLLEKMKDAAHGGFFSEVAADGTPTDRSKDVYMQTFAIYALSEHFLASRDRGSLEEAKALHRLLHEEARDPGSGAYPEILGEDWEVIRGDWESQKEGATRDRREIRTLDTHLHVLECLTTLLEAERDPAAERDLRDVLSILLEKMIDPGSGAGLNEFDGSLHPLPELAGKGTSYGHNVEMAWLCLRTLDVLGERPPSMVAKLRRLVDHALERGWDEEYGGFFMWGALGGGPTHLDKPWWQQAEGLVGLLAMHRETGDPRYLKVFEKLWRFCRRHLLDRRYGEWYHALDRKGRPTNDEKGGRWKAAYHVVRAHVLSIEHLNAILGAA